MRRALTGLLAALVTAPVFAAGGTDFLLHADNDVANLASLQRGARNYVNYCLGCHSLQYVRYKRISTDLGISEEDLMENLMWTADKVHETMTIAMPRDDAARWFGRTPPDLSLTSRSRGTDWIYSYLKGYYVDEDGTFGYNNLMLPGLAMPHVLWQLEGDKAAIFEEVVGEGGNKQQKFVGFEQISEGTMSEAEYDRFVLDLVNFLEYAGEPVKVERQSLGVRVMAYIGLFFLVALALKKEYWKDVK